MTTERAIQTMNAKSKAYDSQRDPKQRGAQRLIRILIHRGRLSRGKCVICGAINAHAHHKTYEVPRLIAWLCPTHHRRVHLGKIELDDKHFVYIQQKKQDGTYKLSRHDMRTLFDLRASGMTQDEVAVKLGICRQTVSYHERRGVNV